MENLSREGKKRGRGENLQSVPQTFYAYARNFLDSFIIILLAGFSVENVVQLSKKGALCACE